MTTPAIQPFFDDPTNTVSYLVSDPATRQAAIIDPVLEWDHKSGTADTAFTDGMLRAAAEQGLAVVLVLENHARPEPAVDVP